MSTTSDSGDEDYEPDSPLTKLQREAEQSEDETLLPAPLNRYKSPSVRDRFGLPIIPSDVGSKTTRKELTDDDMNAVFPPFAPSKPSKLDQWKAYQLRQAPTQKPDLPTEFPIANMGLFGRLPAELRNHIYRLAFVSPQQPTWVTHQEASCYRGACAHTRLSVAAPGMASTCRQIRQELMPIFCGENCFRFDASMVRSRCAAAWIKAMGPYAELFREISLQINVPPDWVDPNVPIIAWADTTIDCPAGRADGQFPLPLPSGREVKDDQAERAAKVARARE